MDIKNIINYQILGQTSFTYIKALIIFLALFILFHFLKKFFLKKILKKISRNDWGIIISKIFKLLHPIFYFLLAFRLAIVDLVILDNWQKPLDWILIGWTTIMAIWGLQFAFDYFFEKKIKTDDPATNEALKLIGKILKAVIWLAAGLFALSNMGVDITSAVAGLGIGGIAVALALQNILGDLFSSFAIYIDKPFVVGDFIVVGDKMGTVEKVGIKTTRIRALQGEEIVFTNKELTSAQVQNFKKMSERRIVFHFGVTYETCNDKLRKIPTIIKEITEDLELVELSRVHFQNFGDFSLNYEVVYLVNSALYDDYMDVQQEINLRLKERFEKENINFAYPTSNIILQKN